MKGPITQRIRKRIRRQARKWRRFPPVIVAFALVNRWRWDHLVIHTRRYTKLPERIALPLLCGNTKGKLSCPTDLTIVLVHNYESEPILEKSLRYVGIDNFVVIKPEGGKWQSNSVKLTELRNYIDRGDCPTDTILYIDSDDAVLRDDPAKAVAYLHDEDCDLLFSSTSGIKHFHYLPECKRWADQLARDHGCKNRYLNTGVFVGKTAFLKEVLDAAADYVTEDDLPTAERTRLSRQGRLLKELPDFPKRCGSDQLVLRFLHRRFHPRIKIDFKGRLALR